MQSRKFITRFLFRPPPAPQEKECCWDLSIDGCRIKHARHLSTNNYPSLRLTLASDDPPILVDLAAVRWVCDQECGIQFLSIQPAQLLRLHKFLASAETSELPPLPNDR